jgi:hypothetical protein
VSLHGDSQNSNPSNCMRWKLESSCVHKVIMSSFCNKTNENANGALTFMPSSSISSCSDDDFSSSSKTNDHDLVEPPMGQLSDPEAEDESNEWKEPPMHQPSDLEVESSMGAYDSSTSSTTTLYLGKGWQDKMKSEKAINDVVPLYVSHESQGLCPFQN